MTADIHLLVGAYALGALDPDEQAAFEAHLTECTGCRTEAAELMNTAATLADAGAEPVPASLLDRVMAEVRETPQLAPSIDPPAQSRPDEPASGSRPARSAPGAIPASSSRRPAAAWTRPGAGRWLAAAAALVLVALVGSLVVYRLATPNPEDLVAEVVDDPASQRYSLDGSLVGQVDVHVAPEGRQAAVVASQLPAVPADRTYELWVVADGVPHAAATFTPDEAGNVRVAFLVPTDGIEQLAVTVEPQGGSPVPTPPIVLTADA